MGIELCPLGEVWKPWLDCRFRCYARTDDPRLAAAFADLRRFEARDREALLPEE